MSDDPAEDIEAAVRREREVCADLCRELARQYREDVPADWAGREGGIPADWIEVWETVAETADELAEAILARSTGRPDPDLVRAFQAWVDGESND